MGLRVAADGFRGLQQMLDLGELSVWIAFVDQGVEKFHGLPDAHLGAVPGEELFFLIQNEIASLVSMILAVKLANTRRRGLAIIAEFVGLFLLSVASLDEVVPLFKAPERAKLIRYRWFHGAHGWVLLLLFAQYLPCCAGVKRHACTP